MSQKTLDSSLRQGALVSGVAIIMMTIAAIFATDVTMGSLVVEDNSIATYDNITSAPMTFRAGIFSWLVILICDLFAAWGLFLFFKPVNQSLSLVMAWFRLIYTAMLGTAILRYVDVLYLIGPGETNSTIEQIQLLVMQSVSGFQNMWSLGLIVFAIHVYFVGHLILKSDYVPKWIGIVLIIAFIGYTVTNLMGLLLPNYEELRNLIEWIFILPMLSEVYLGFWLLIKGLKIKSMV